MQNRRREHGRAYASAIRAAGARTVPPARTGRGSTRPCSWPRGAACRRGPWPRRSAPVGAVSAGASTASRPRRARTAGAARQKVRAEPGDPPALRAGRSAARRHRPAPRRHRARGRRPAGRPAGPAPCGNGGAGARGQTPRVAGRAGQQQSASPDATRSRPRGLTPRPTPSASRARPFSARAGKSASRRARRTPRRRRCCRA